MKQVVMNLQSYLFAQAVERSLKEDGDFMIRNIEDPEEVIRQCQLVIPDILFLEVTAYTPWKLIARMKIHHDKKETYFDDLRSDNDNGTAGRLWSRILKYIK